MKSVYNLPQRTISQFCSSGPLLIAVKLKAKWIFRTATIFPWVTVNLLEELFFVDVILY